MSINIGIIDLNCNNIFSIYGLCKNLNKKTKIIKNYKQFDNNVDLIILPGVGAFSNAMQALQKTNLFEKYMNIQLLRIKSFGNLFRYAIII